MIKVGMADDHTLIRQGLADMIHSFGDFQVVWQAANGVELTRQIAQIEPDIILLDIRMPEMDGYETAAWLAKHHPSTKVLVLSMMDDDFAIVKMLKLGAKGYVQKDTDPQDLRHALSEVVRNGFYFNNKVTGKMLHAVVNGEAEAALLNGIQLTEKEEEFLKLACTELTYKEIAERMFVSPRTVDGYRDILFDKTGVRSRVGLVMFALKRGIARL